MSPTLLAYLMLDATRRKYDWVEGEPNHPNEERLVAILEAMDNLWWKLSSEEAEAINSMRE